MQSSTFARSSIVLLLVISLVCFAQASELPRYTTGGEVIHGGRVDLAKAGGDTINLMSTRHDPTNGAGEPFYLGDFENGDGHPAWNGWTHRDYTAPIESHWNVSTYNQPDPSNHAAWCEGSGWL